MGKCKNCKYWLQDSDSLTFYNENFGFCTHEKVINLDCIETDYKDEEHKRYNKFDVIYSADECADIKMNKEYGCINFCER